MLWRYRLRHSSGLNPVRPINLLGRFLGNFQLRAVLREMNLCVRYNAKSKNRGGMNVRVSQYCGVYRLRILLGMDFRVL